MGGRHCSRPWKYNGKGSLVSDRLPVRQKESKQVDTWAMELHLVISSKKKNRDEGPEAAGDAGCICPRLDQRGREGDDVNIEP